VVHPSFPAHTVAELIAYAKANPGKVNYGSAGTGSVNHITGEYFARTAGITLVHIPTRHRAGADRSVGWAHPDGAGADSGHQSQRRLARLPPPGAFRTPPV